MTNFTDKPDLGELSQNGFFDIQNPPFDIQKHLLLSCVSGSNAYGIATPTSDLDVRGVVYMPEDFVLGLQSCEQIENQSKDICYYEIAKFISLSLKNNVHALEIMHIGDESIKFINPFFKEFLNKNKQKFLSQRIKYSFGGYAFQQSRMALTKKANNTGRKELIEKYGIDTKAIAHCIRIYRMGREILLGEEFKVKRPDAPLLLDIRNGKYSVKELIQEGLDDSGNLTFIGGLVGEEHRLFKEACDMTQLPLEPNFVEINMLLINLRKNLLSL